MKHRRIIRKTMFALLCLFLVTLWAGIAGAQDISKNKTKRSVDDKAIEAAQKRREDLSKALDKDKKGQGQDLAKGPDADLQAARDAAQKRSPEEIEQLKLKIEQKNRAMITKLDQIIQGDPYSDSKPEWMFQKAELMWELRNWEYLRGRAEYNQCLEAASKGTIEESKCQEPLPDYEDAQAIYQDILQQYPNYARLDEVIYRLGRGLIEAKKGAQAVPLLQRLVQNYPNSQYLPEAYLALGEFYFDKNVFGLAKTNYEEVLKFNSYDFYDYALYKLGWTHYNQQEYRDSIDTFKKVVERPNDKLGFQAQAINDLIVAFAAVDDGWKEARTYFLAKRDKEFTYDKMGRMASYLEGKGQDEDAVSIYSWFIDERPNHTKIPEWMESILIAKKKNENNLEDTEASMNRFIAYLDPQGTWAQKNKDDKGAISNAALLTEASLAYLAGFYHQRAQKNEVLADYKKAAGYYEKFVARFPENPSSFDMNFFLGEIYLLSLKELEKAAAQYQKVVDLYKQNNIPKGVDEKQAQLFVKDAAYAVVQSYNELVKANHQDSILVKMSEAADKSKDGVFQTKDKMDLKTDAPNPRVELLRYEEGFVKASDQWGEMYPKDDATPTIDYVAAEVYKARGHYDRCVPRYENIITNAPKHRYASFAGASLLDANYRLKKWDDVEKWARYLLQNKIFYVTPEQGLRETIAFAINERAIELKTAGQTDEAAGQLVRLAEEFPKSDLAPGALFNAAAIYESGEQITKAISTYERVVKDYGDSEQASSALFVMGAIFESRADFDRAASYFERLATPKYRDRENSADAVYNAASLRKAMEQWDKAIEVYEKYVELYPTRDDVQQVQLELAYLEKQRKNPKASLKRFTDYVDGKDLKGKKVKDRTIAVPQQVEIYTQIGLLNEQLKDKKWEQTSEAAFKKSIELYAKLTDEADQRKAREFASHAKFQLAERVFERFVAVKLSFPDSKLQRLAVEKGTLEQEAEKLYAEVIQMKHPYWTSASAYRIGQMYKNFSDELYGLPIPEGLDDELRDLYQMAVDDLAFPLQEKALLGFRTALKLALELKSYNEWSSKSAQEISKLESQSFPITSQEGVAPGYDRMQFTRTTMLTDTGKVGERLKARKGEADRIKAEQEAARQAQQPATPATPAKPQQ